MPTRACITWTPDGRCLGHPEVDAELFPPLCPQHLDLFMPLIEAKARILASQMLHEQMSARPRWNGSSYVTGPRKPATAMLKRGQHLTDQDRATLNFLRGAA